MAVSESKVHAQCGLTLFSHTRRAGLRVERFSAAAMPGEDADSLIAKGDEFDQTARSQGSARVLSARKQNPAGQCRTSRPYRAAVSPLDERRRRRSRKSFGSEIISLEFAQRAADPRSEEFRGTALAGDQLRKNASLHGQQGSGRRLAADQSSRWIAHWRSIRTTTPPGTSSGDGIASSPTSIVVKRVLAKAIYGDLPVTTNEEAETVS